MDVNKNKRGPLRVGMDGQKGQVGIVLNCIELSFSLNLCFQI